MIRAGLVAVFLVAAFVTGCGGHGRAAGTIVFQTYGTGRAALYAVRPDGRRLTRLPVNLPADGADVSWTRDGTKALVMYDNGNGGVVAYVFEPASGTRRHIQLPGVEEVSDMPWSPDGKRLALATDDGDVVLDVKTGVRRHVSDELNSDLLTWSADGKSLLFPAERYVYAAPAIGGPATLLLRLAHLEPVELQLSSDGKWISFEQIGANRDELYVVRPNGTGLHLIARDAESSAWSPTGERLAFAGYKGIVLVDVENGRRRRLTSDRLDDPANEAPAWSPDGQRLLYLRDDLGYGAVPGFHMQLWTMKADGTDRHPVTRAFPGGGGNDSAGWAAGNLEGTPLPRLPLVSLPATRTVTTAFPIVGLAAESNRAAVAQGFGGTGAGRAESIIVWNRVRGTRLQIPVRGCVNAYDVVLGAGGVVYLCDHSGVGYATDETLRLVRTGKRSAVKLAHAYGNEFSGSFLGGLAGDGNAIVFDVGVLHGWRGPHTRSRIWKATRAEEKVVRTFRGEAGVTSLDAGRIAVLRDGNAVSVLFPDGGIRTFTFGRPRILGAALDGPRLLVLQTTRLTAIDLRNGRRAASRPVRRGFGPAPELEDVQGDLAAYLVGVAVHVLRLSDGRDIVIDTPNATGPIFARFVPSGLFYSFNESYEKRPGRLVFVARAELERALVSKAARR